MASISDGGQTFRRGCGRTVHPALTRRLVSLALVLATGLLTRRAEAHAIGLSRGEYRVEGEVVRAKYVFAGTELATTLPEIDADGDGTLSPTELEHGRTAVEQSIVQGTLVRADGSDCEPKLEEVAAEENDAVEIRASFFCGHAPRVLSINCRFIERFSAGHRHMATLSGDGNETSFMLVPARKEARMELDAATRPTTNFGAMVWMGMTHIWTGYDHIAFLLGLLLLGGRVRTLVGLISAFTVAHSITLALAVTRTVSVRPSFVEPAIALSIAYVGLENLTVPNPSRRWRITFPFGLIHGFGFSAALTELDLPRAQIPKALFAFNLGVEIGQLAIVAVLLPLILWARRHKAFTKWGVSGISLALVVAGCAWFGLRIRT